MWLFLAGCVVEGRDDWEALPVTSAWFEQFDRSTVAFFGGVVEGDALLAWEGPYGPGAMPVHLGGGTVGLAFSFLGDIEGHASDVPIDLSRVDDPTVADLLGTYKGSGGGFGVVLGFAGGRARNGRGASFREDHFALGLGVWAGFDWVVVRPAVPEDYLDTGVYTTSPYTSPYGYTSPYTPPTTPYTPPTGEPEPIDTGPYEDTGDEGSGGCGGGSKSEDTGWSSSSDPSTGGTTPSNGSSSSSSSSSSSGSTTWATGNSSSCDHTRASRLWLLGALPLLAAGRRRRFLSG